MSSRATGPRISWWRLWTLQGSFNPRRLQALGWWVAMARAWEARGLSSAELRERLSREPDSPNTNPYLAGLVFGASLRLQDEGEEERARRLCLGLSRALGGLGDRATWTAVRPAMALTALLGSLWWGAWVAVAVALVFAVSQAWLRRRCVLEGYQRGEEVIALLEHPRIHALVDTTERGAAVLAGAVAIQVLWTVNAASPSGSDVLVPGGVALLLGVALAWRSAPAEIWLVALLLLSYWRATSVGSS